MTEDPDEDPERGRLRAEIAAAQTPNGGWTRADLARWGVPWPPPKGWRKALVGPSRKTRRGSRGRGAGA